MSEKLDRSCQYVFAAQKAGCILSFIKGRMASKSRELIAPLYSAVMTSHLDYCIQVPGHERRGSFQIGPEEGHENSQRAETLVL